MSPLSPRRFLVLLGTLLVVLGAALVVVHERTARLRRAAADATAHRAELNGLQQQGAALAAGLPDPATWQAMRTSIQSLEADRNALEAERAAFQRASLENLARSTALPPATATTDAPLPRDRPEVTMQSVLRAVQDGRADELATLLDFDDDARREAEAFFTSLPPDLQEEYASPARLVAHVMTARTSGHDATIQVMADTVLGPDDRSLRLALHRDNGQLRTATFQLHRAPDGWRLRVPTRVIEGYRALVTGYVPLTAQVSSPEKS